MNLISPTVRVLVVDDSAFIRYTLTKHLEADPAISVVGTARDGLEALAKIPALRPDVVTMDVEMPGMDGLTTLQRVMKECPTPVIMLSSLTQRGARTTIQALMRGAVDFVPKPTASTDLREVIEELIAKIKAAAGVRSMPALSSVAEGVSAAGYETPAPRSEERAGLSPFRIGDPLVIIGSSTGGPRALQQVIPNLPGDLPAAVVVIQHMPAGFTAPLAQRLNEASVLTVQEAADGDRLARGLVLLAPGDYHLRFQGGKQVVLDQGPRVNHVRPSVDVTIESAVAYHGAAVIGVILTGMGSDGAAGARLIKQAGGRVIVEDESTAVVYGMPRSVAEAGLADVSVPLPEVASVVIQMVNDGATRI